MSHGALSIVVTDADGATKTLSSDSSAPGDRPRGIGFSTQAGSGFYTASFNLARPVDEDHDDLHLLDDVKIIGENGDTAYEGYIVELPRSMDDAHTLSVSCAGWMAHAADESFSMGFVDRDLARWAGPGSTRQANLLGGGYGKVNPPATTTDESGRQAVRTAFDGKWAAAGLPIAEAWYDAGAWRIGTLYAGWTRGAWVSSGTGGGADTNFAWGAYLSNDDVATSTDASGDLQAAGPGSVTVFATGDDRRYAVLQHYYTTGPAGIDGVDFNVDWDSVAVYGNHDLPGIGSTPEGIAASEVIKYLTRRYCPRLNTAGVRDTTYPISHLVFEDTKPYDAFLRVNTYHLWQLAVWENRTLHFAPADLTDWDWEVRADEVGTTIGLQGDSVENLRAGIIVTYTNVATGKTEQLHPDDHPSLRDSSIHNPWVRHGRRAYGEPYAIPFPTTEADALELGRVKLLEDNQVSAPGQFTVTSRIKDRAGTWQPVWKVRSGDTIRLTSSAALSDRPRLIGEVSYAHDGQAATITVDSTARYLDAFIDRMSTALTAANLAG